MQKIRKIKTDEYAFTVLYEPVKEGGFKVTVPVLSGLITYGRTLEEARIMIQDAIVCHLEGIKKGKAQILRTKYRYYRRD